MNLRHFLLFFAAVLTLTGVQAHHIQPSAKRTAVQTADTTRIAELNSFWERMAQTVATGDFEGYTALYHPDAVLVMNGEQRKGSMPIAQAFAGWKQGFEDTRSGKAGASVAFRFSQRIGDATTAHETGMFAYAEHNADGSIKRTAYVHLQGLLVKKDGQWLLVMELQGDRGTAADWEALE